MQLSSLKVRLYKVNTGHISDCRDQAAILHNMLLREKQEKQLLKDEKAMLHQIYQDHYVLQLQVARWFAARH